MTKSRVWVIVYIASRFDITCKQVTASNILEAIEKSQIDKSFIISAQCCGE